ncbi:MAG: metallophosphoesterase [Bacteroidia bacterium]|nr:metallophosphoesterase [Bacteroidia bacterium]
MATETNFDFIGDIHGHADALEKLLQKLEYRIDKATGIYFHPKGRKIFFVGDFIDRGPKIKETLELVKSMTDTGNAMAVMGNHEYNALCFWHKHEGEFLRPHITKNIHQHTKTIEAFRSKDEELQYYLQWFSSLPIYYESDLFRVIHANWDLKQIDVLRNKKVTDFTDPSFLIESNTNEKLKDAVEILLKGNEEKHEKHFTDKDGNTRFEYRVKWWRNNEPQFPKEYLFEFPDHEFPEKTKPRHTIYLPEERPVFFGHYWLRAEKPELMSHNCCCLDYSVAKEGLLVAYRFNGEQKLDEENFVWV